MNATSRKMLNKSLKNGRRPVILVKGEVTPDDAVSRRRPRMGWRLATVLCLGMLTAAARAHAEDAPKVFDAASLEYFEKSVRPILTERCQSCHGESKQKANLRLDSRDSIIKGGETGPAALPGNSKESLIVEAIQYGETLQMPPKSRLPEKDVATLTKWVEMGLPWPQEASPSTPSSGVKPTFDLKARRKAHWAWSPVKSVVPPEVKDQTWPRGPEDRFILQKLDAKGLKPAAEAGPVTLIRRLSFDITGLPPTPAEVDAFVHDTRPDAYQRVVDRLLDSPRYGERWARHWLDLVRYAETRGHEFDPVIPNAWQYRDYLVRALNADVPYDLMLNEHIAGDLIERPRLDPKTQANESILGTGFWFLGEEVHSPVDIRQDETDRLDNRLDVMTKTFLGLTVGCARCHDHKFDAISQRDYYALSGYLISSTYRQARFATMEKERQAAENLQKLHDGAVKNVRGLTASLIRSGNSRLASDLLAARAAIISGEKTIKDPALKRWADLLNRAKNDPHDPFHAFATIGCEPSSSQPLDFAKRLSRLTGFDNPAFSSTQPESVTNRFDFAELQDLSRFQNGYAFGMRPTYPGDLVIEGDSTRPSLGFFTKVAARRDSAFDRLTLSDATEHDHGRIGEWNRPGQTVRTPEFTIGKGPFHYLAKGPGRAYASVNSHLLVAGPLHAAVTMEWTDGGKGWRWVKHDLSVYEGHRAHIEFTPSAKGEFAVAEVIQAIQPPGSVDHCNHLLISFLNADVNCPEKLAKAYESLLSTLADLVEGRPVRGMVEVIDVSRLADFVLRNASTFAPETCSSRESLRTEAKRLYDAKEAIAATLAEPAPSALAIMDGNGVDEHLLIRGSSRTPGATVPRGFLEALTSEPPSPASQSGSGRLQLARQMTDLSDPFASRVIVNRIWHHLFGRGIVATVDNFGVLGELPSHPELLDFLADRFRTEGWSQKRLIRELVTSQTYRMASTPEPVADLADPRNFLLHRRELKRLEAEPLRDSILSVAHRLDGRIGGPSVPVYLSPAMQGRGRPTKSGPRDGDGRRSLYLAIRRNFLAPMMLAYDAPIPFSCVGRRNVSNVPAQALILMNDPFVVEQASLWAGHVLEDSARSPAERITAMYREAFGRNPNAAEVEDAVSFLKSQANELAPPSEAWKADHRVWSDLAHMLFNAKEFVFVD